MKNVWKAFLLAWALHPVAAVAGGSVRYYEPYAVEGLGVGMSVAPESRQYKRYNCRPSEQYAESIVCRLSEKQGRATKAITILHLYDNVVTYINKSLTPASFTVSEVQNELDRLSKTFGGYPHVQTSSAGVIATWGDISLVALSRPELMMLAQGGNPKLGFLVDYLMNFQESARTGLPVYSLSGGKGFIWIARYQGNGRPASLRFLAADPSKMVHANIETESPQIEIPQPPEPKAASPDLIEKEIKKRLEAEARKAAEKAASEAAKKATEATDKAAVEAARKAAEATGKAAAEAAEKAAAKAAAAAAAQQKSDEEEKRWKLKEAKDKGYATIEEYENFLEKQRRLNESGIILKPR